MIVEGTPTIGNGLDSIVDSSMSIDIVIPTIVVATDTIDGVPLAIVKATATVVDDALSVDEFPSPTGLDSDSSVGGSR